MISEKEMQGLIELLLEASVTLQILEETCNEYEDIPRSYRYPLKDELHGFACMLRDKNKEIK